MSRKRFGRNELKESAETGLVCGLCGGPIHVGVVSIDFAGIPLHEPCWSQWPGRSQIMMGTGDQKASWLLALMSRAQEVYGGVDQLQEAMDKLRVRLEGGRPTVLGGGESA